MSVVTRSVAEFVHKSFHKLFAPLQSVQPEYQLFGQTRQRYGLRRRVYEVAAFRWMTRSG